MLYRAGLIPFLALLLLLVVVVVVQALLVVQGASVQPHAPRSWSIPPAIRRLRVSGDVQPYDLGYVQGYSFGSLIQSFLAEDTFFTQALRPFVMHNTMGQSTFTNLLDINSKVFPGILDEIRGISDGANVSMSDLLILSFQSELYAAYRYLNQSASGLSNIDPVLLDCSDVLLPGMIGHNEDTRMVVKYSAYLLETDAFTAYSYPGFLSGMAWSFSRYGLTLSANAVFPKSVFPRGLGRYWLTRAALEATSVDDLLNIVSGKKYGVKIAYGFSLNVGDVNAGQTMNLEMYPLSHTVTTTKCTSYLFHFNMYMYNSTSVDQYTDVSTIHRLARARTMPPPVDEKTILAILGDSQDRQYPIFRTAVPPDSVATVSTVVFDLSQKTATVWVGNPLSTSSVLVLPLSSG